MKLRTFIIWLILALLWLVVVVKCSSEAHAGERKLWLNIHMTSWHSEDSYTKQQIRYINYQPKITAPYNNKNYGLGLAYAFNDQFEARAGCYNNSHEQMSCYLGGAAYTSSKRLISVGVNGGFIIGGYEGESKGGDIEYKEIIPFAQPAIWINLDRWRIEPGYIPKVTGDGAHIVTLTAGINF